MKPKMIPLFPLVDARTLAELFHVKQTTIFKWVDTKSIPFYRMSDKCLRFDVLEVLKAKKQIS